MTNSKKEAKSDSPEKNNNKPLKIDWTAMSDDVEDEEVPPELVIVSSKIPSSSPDNEKTLSGSLEEQLERNKAHLIKLGPSLPDKGERIRLKIARLEAEKKLRDQNRKSKPDVVKSCKETEPVTRSTFFNVFKPKTDDESMNAFVKELEDLGCQSGKQKVVTRSNKNGWEMPSKVGKGEHSGNQKSNGFSYGKKKRNGKYSLIDDDDENDSNGHDRDWSGKGSSSQNSKRHKKSDDTVINVDEEEPQTSTVAAQVAELPEGLQEEICYPTRDDRSIVQVCLKDLECLAPQEFLTSPIMNFYIRFLEQESSSNQISANCHFFNTFFYKKLTDAAAYKGKDKDDKDAFFVKFRRWWKGIDLFRKAYIFIPIHEDLHWSLVIVCIPDKEDESGVTILHLDSLGLHSKRSIIENVKRFLKDEWNHLKNQDDYVLDLPISDKLWKNLPRRFTETDIQVPQQKNDFDCGPFVLFFIKRFIEEAPQRLKRKDLGMFDKKWFRPDEASALRVKIRNTLIDLFRVSKQTDCHNGVSKQTDCHNDVSKQTDEKPV